MATNKNVDKIVIAAVFIAVIITILFINGEKFGIVPIIDEDAEGYESDGFFTSNDLNGNWDSSSSTVITLEGEEIEITGGGAYENDGSVYISTGGEYIISGNLTDGNIVVDAYQSSKVWLLFDGVEIYKEDDAGLRINQADKVFLTLKEGSKNTIETGEEYSEAALSDGAGGAIFTHDDLTINGSGELEIKTAYKHGIDANDSLVITGGKITIESEEDALHVNDDIRLTECDITINTGDDGIHSGDYFVMTSGSVTINECYEGIEALTIDIYGGDIVIYPEDDGLNANGGSGGFGAMGGNPGGPGGNNGQGEEAEKEEVEETDQDTQESDETWIHIYDGNITVVNEDGMDADGLDSNGDIIINGGNIRVSLIGNGSNCALDYGSESGGILQINGGTVAALGGSSMLEEVSDTSSQASITYVSENEIEAGEIAAVRDSLGNILLSYEAPCSYTSMIISCDGLKVGETYTVISGDEEEEVTLESVTYSNGSGGFGMGQRGGMGGHGAGSDMAMPGQGGGMTPPDRDMAGFEGEMPGFGGEMPEGMASSTEGSVSGNEMHAGGRMGRNGDMGGEMGGPGEFGSGFMDQSQSGSDMDTGNLKSLSEYEPRVFIMLGISGIIVIAGIIFAGKYKRRKN